MQFTLEFLHILYTDLLYAAPLLAFLLALIIVIGGNYKTLETG